MSFLVKISDGCLTINENIQVSTQRNASQDNSYFFTGILTNKTELLTQLQLNIDCTNHTLIDAAFRKWAYDIVHYLKGEFALVIWDNKKKHLIAFRDQIGIVPLYYYYDQTQLVLSPDANSILRLKSTKKILLESWPIDYICGTTHNYKRTLNEKLFRLKASHKITFHNNKLAINQYWKPDFTNIYNSDKNYIEVFKEKLTLSIKNRIATENHVGAEISGGLDSTIISAYANQYTEHNEKTLSVFSDVYPENKIEKIKDFYDEIDDVKSVIKYCHLKNSYLIDNSKANLIDMLELSNQIQFEPSYRMIDIFSSAIYKKAQQLNISTLFSGFGGDEIVSSRRVPDFKSLLKKKDFAHFFQLLLKYYPKIGLSLPYPNAFLTAATDLLSIKTRKVNKQKTASKIDRLFIKESILQDSGFRQNIIDIKLKRVSKNYYKQFEQKIFGPSVMAPRLHSCYAATQHFQLRHSYPLLDLDLIEYYFSIPDQLKGDNNMRRTIIRKAAKGYLPNNIVHKTSKLGASNPSAFTLTPRFEFEILDRLKDYTITKNHRIHDYIYLDKLIENEEKLLRSERIMHSAAIKTYLLVRKLDEY